MSIELFLLLANLADNLDQGIKLLRFMATIGLIVCVGGYVPTLIEGSVRLQRMLERYGKGLIITIIALTCVGMFVPSSKTLYMIGGVHFTKDAFQGHGQIFDKSLQVLEQKLDEILAEGKEGKK